LEIETFSKKPCAKNHPTMDTKIEAKRKMNPQKERKKSEFREMMNLPMKMMMTPHQRSNCSKPSGLETPR
jgi:hypothetical protein